MWYIYIVRCADNSFYTGITKDLTQRLHHHNADTKGAKYIRSRRPATLVYKESTDTRSGALKREAEIKRLSHREKEHLCMGLN